MDSWHAFCYSLHESSSESKTLLLVDSRCRKHVVLEGHVERPERFTDAERALKGLLRKYPASFSLQAHVRREDYLVRNDHTGEYTEEVLRVHSAGYLDGIWAKSLGAGSQPTWITRKSDAGREPDTWGNKDTWEAASVGFALALEAVDAVVAGQAHNAFVICRPPGHHAGRNGVPELGSDASEDAQAVGLGFCFLNNVVGAAKHAHEKWGLQRVTVVDFDLHAGNKTACPYARVVRGHCCTSNPACHLCPSIQGTAQRSCWGPVARGPSSSSRSTLRASSLGPAWRAGPPM